MKHNVDQDRITVSSIPTGRPVGWDEAAQVLRNEKRRELQAITDLSDYMAFFDDAFEMSRQSCPFLQQVVS